MFTRVNMACGVIRERRWRMTPPNRKAAGVPRPRVRAPPPEYETTGAPFSNIRVAYSRNESMILRSAHETRFPVDALPRPGYISSDSRTKAVGYRTMERGSEADVGTSGAIRSMNPTLHEVSVSPMPRDGRDAATTDGLAASVVAAAAAPRALPGSAATSSAPLSATMPSSPAPATDAGLVDLTLLDQVVLDLNRLCARRGLELAHEITAVILDAFFGGSIDEFRERERGHHTFRALAERPDLDVSYTTIWYAVSVVDQLRHLPDDVGSQLSLAHHKALLPLRDAESKRAWAERALAESLSARALRAAIDEERALTTPPSRAGRPKLPALVKAIPRLRHALDLATSEPITAELLASLPDEAREELRRVVEGLRGLGV